MTDHSTTLYCANHPHTETLLRCNRCEKSICSKCAVLTPTGYRCRECVRDQQKVFETAQWYDLPLAFITSVILSYLGSLIAGRLGFLILFVAPIMGTIIAEAARFITRRRRSQRLFQTVAAGTLIGGLPSLLRVLIGVIVLSVSINGPMVFGSFYNILWQGLYVVTVTTTAYYRVK